MHSFDPPYSHNGVKPDNVLITQRKDQPHLAILMDFESARPARIAIRSQADAMQLQVPFCLSKYAKQTLSSIYITACWDRQIVWKVSINDSWKILFNSFLVINRHWKIICSKYHAIFNLDGFIFKYNEQWIYYFGSELNSCRNGHQSTVLHTTELLNCGSVQLMLTLMRGQIYGLWDAVFMQWCKIFLCKTGHWPYHLS